MALNNDSKVLLRTEGLKKYYPAKEQLSKRLIGYVKAVDDVNFSIREGEVLALVGESGCGKSTTGYLIMRLESPTSGKIFFNDENILELDKRQTRKMRCQIQMVFQDSHSSLNPHMLIREIIEEPLVIHHMPKAERKKRVDELLKMVGLSQEHAERYPHELSGGQRQRVGIARALALNPKLIIADEPVSALDVSVQAQIINLLVKLQRELNLSYLFITHDLSVARYISNRIAVMYLGEIIEIGDKEEIFTNPKHPYTKVLLEAVPSTDPERVQKNPVQISDLPSPLAPPSGCHYHTRCAMAMKCCATEKPAPVKISEDHQVCCHLYSAAKEQ